MKSYLIRNAQIVDSGRIFFADVLIRHQRIERISPSISNLKFDHEELDASGQLLIPGVIDDQVHFREPGLTHKADIYTESRAAVAGGITSFMEMPNTNPQTVTQDALNKKYETGARVSLGNYSFYIGATNDNLEELLKTDPEQVCGIKIFMGSSTGNMLVDNENTLAGIFSASPMLKAVHCEDETTVQNNIEIFKKKLGNNASAKHHPLIRSEEACYLSSSYAVKLAQEYNSRLHVLHISTAKELELFKPGLDQKLITAEVCVHHLWFDEEDYDQFGNRIKWNPSIKKKSDKEALLNAVLNERLDVIATDHAPHTLEEKNKHYWEAPSGGPLVQHSLVAMLDLYHQGKIPLETIIDKMCHAPARLFNIVERGFIREGYFADLVLVDLNAPWKVTSNNILYKCGWSPFEGHTFRSKVTHSFVNGHLAYENGRFDDSVKGQRLLFNK